MEASSDASEDRVKPTTHKHWLRFIAALSVCLSQCHSCSGHCSQKRAAAAGWKWPCAHAWHLSVLPGLDCKPLKCPGTHATHSGGVDAHCPAQLPSTWSVWHVCYVALVLHTQACLDWLPEGAQAFSAHARHSPVVSNFPAAHCWQRSCPDTFSGTVRCPAAHR